MATQTTREKLDAYSSDRLEADVDRADLPLESANWSTRQIFAGILISIAAFGCFAYLLGWNLDKLKDVQTMAVTLVVLAAVPWLGLYVRDFKVGKDGVTATLVEQQKSINALEMIVTALVTDFELEILGNLIRQTGREYKLVPKRGEVFYESDKRMFVRLIGLGLLEFAVPGQGFGFWEDRFNNAPENDKPVIFLFSKPYFIVPTQRGRNFYRLYERVHGRIDLDELDKQTFGRLC